MNKVELDKIKRQIEDVKNTCKDMQVLSEEVKFQMSMVKQLNKALQGVYDAN